MRIGWVYAGSTGFQYDHWRSTTRDQWADLLALPYDWVELQVGRGGAYQPADWAETARMLTTLDRLITVDTSIGHLAGALGVPTWVLIPYMADWRWGEAGETTPWYPNHRLFRQPAKGDWGSVFQRVRDALVREVPVTAYRHDGAIDKSHQGV